MKCYNFFCESYVNASNDCCYSPNTDLYIEKCKHRKAFNRFTYWLDKLRTETGYIYQTDVEDKLKQIKNELEG